MIRDKFIEYMSLSYTKKDHPSVLRDIPIDDVTIVRLDWRGCRVLYLYSGSTLLIPECLIDIFSGFYKYSGRELNFSYPDSVENLDPEEQFIYYMTELQTYLFSGFSKIGKTEFFDTLYKICELGTPKFIEWCKKEWPKLDLKPIEFLSFEKTESL